MENCSAIELIQFDSIVKKNILKKFVTDREEKSVEQRN